MSSRAGPSTKRITRSAAKQEIGDVPADSTARIPLPSKSGLVEAESGEHDQPPRKRVKTSTPEPEPKPTAAPLKRTRGKQGKLQGLMNMPVDIFTEIAIHLHPIDLVYLARANKFFRELLMNRSFIHIWRCAERSVEGLPPCPEGLCEPQYASLVFAKCCSTCGGQALRPMDPILQVRLCVKCRDEQAINVLKIPVDSSLVFRSRDFVPGKYQEIWYLDNDARAVRDELDAFERAGNLEEKVNWIEKRKVVVKERIKKSLPLTRFLKSIESGHGAELSSVREQRQAEVKSRLLKLGYEGQDMMIYERHWQKQWKSAACIAKPLTERG